MANPTNRQLWESGVPLDCAWLEFASADAKGRHSSLPTFSDTVGTTAPKSAIEFVRALSSGWNAKLARGNAERELRELLRAELFNDALHAYGYRVSPSPSRSPVRIAAELFGLHNPNWQSESLLARGIEYAEIRGVDPSRMIGFRKPRTGRKGSAQVIRKAIAALHNEGFDLCGIERKLACEAIRQRVGNECIKGSGLTDVNLNKYVLEICPKRGLDN